MSGITRVSGNDVLASENEMLSRALGNRCFELVGGDRNHPWHCRAFADDFVSRGSCTRAYQRKHTPSTRDPHLSPHGHDARTLLFRRERSRFFLRRVDRSGL